MPGMLTSRITERSQTTVPRGVRAALGIQPGERLGYVIEGNEVKLVNASAIEEAGDPVLEQLLDLLASDVGDGRHVAAFPASLVERVRAATAGVAVDHDADIDGVTAL